MFTRSATHIYTTTKYHLCIVFNRISQRRKRCCLKQLSKFNLCLPGQIFTLTRGEPALAEKDKLRMGVLINRIL